MPAVPACAALPHPAALLRSGHSYGTEAEVSMTRKLGPVPGTGFKFTAWKWKVVLLQKFELLLPVTGMFTASGNSEKYASIATESFAALR